MKKHRDSDELAARIAVAASKPAGSVSVAPVGSVPQLQPANDVPTAAAPRRKRAAKKAADADTVPISLRPARALLNRYVLAAATRTQEAGRVISAQEIMLEVLERGQ
jgi:hypothetical protein